MGDDVTGDEAAWRDLIARYEMPVASDGAAMPWPERENLENRPRDPSLQVADAPSAPDLGSDPDAEKPLAPPELPEIGAPGNSAPGNSAPDNSAPDNSAPDNSAPGNETPSNETPHNGNGERRAPGASGDRTRVVRHASSAPRPPRADGDDDEDEDNRYVPPPPPPLPELDSVAKGAWAALFGGPAYLVVATILGWHVSGWAALAAITAFVGGFAAVILRMGDGPSRGDGPDNGAVL